MFIAGNDEALGSWKANGFPLSLAQENLWFGSARLPAHGTLEFKITRGSWNKEEILEDGTVPSNRILPPGGDVTIDRVVRRWKDSLPHAEPSITGNFRFHENVVSSRLRLSRDVIVWLPPSYAESPERRYPVLYMHDGQQVFDPNTSTHQQDWEVDETCTRLIAQGRMREIIVVAIYCTEDRRSEYDPSILGLDYAHFLTAELKQMIDKEYRTLPGRADTAVAGASMGGKISFHLAWTHPDIFFGAACLSPAFIWNGERYELDMAERTRKKPDLRFYLYCGGNDELEQKLLPGVREMAEILRRKEFVDGQDLVVVEDPQAEHNEAAWAEVTEQWLLFLFGS